MPTRLICAFFLLLITTFSLDAQSRLRFEVGGSLNGAGWDFSAEETSASPKFGYTLSTSYKWCFLPKNKAVYIAPTIGVRTLGFNSVLSGDKISLDAKYLQSGMYIGFDAYQTGNILLAVEGLLAYDHALSGEYREAEKSLEAFGGRFKAGNITLGGSIVAYYGRYLYARLGIQNMFVNISNIPNYKATPISYTLSLGLAI